MLDEVAVGQNRCPDADGEARPFVVEWDATDLATFEAKSARDLIFVEYEGSEVELLYGRCKDATHFVSAFNLGVSIAPPRSMTRTLGEASDCLWNRGNCEAAKKWAIQSAIEHSKEPEAEAPRSPIE